MKMKLVILLIAFSCLLAWPILVQALLDNPLLSLLGKKFRNIIQAILLAIKNIVISNLLQLKI